MRVYPYGGTDSKKFRNNEAILSNGFLALSYSDRANIYDSVHFAVVP